MVPEKVFAHLPEAMGWSLPLSHILSIISSVCGPDPTCDLKNPRVHCPGGCKHSITSLNPLCCLSICLLMQLASYGEHAECLGMEFGVG